MKRFFTNRIIASLLCVCMLLPLCACSKDEPVQKQIFAMDTVMNLTAYGKYANDGISAAVGVINAMDDMLDPSNEGSYTNLINNAEGKTSPDKMVLDLRINSVRKIELLKEFLNEI